MDFLSGNRGGFVPARRPRRTYAVITVTIVTKRHRAPQLGDRVHHPNVRHRPNTGPLPHAAQGEHAPRRHRDVRPVRSRGSGGNQRSTRAHRKQRPTPAEGRRGRVSASPQVGQGARHPRAPRDKDPVVDDGRRVAGARRGRRPVGVAAGDIAPSTTGRAGTGPQKNRGGNEL